MRGWVAGFAVPIRRALMVEAGAGSLAARRLMLIPALTGGQRGKGASPQAGQRLLGGAGFTAVAWHPGWRRGEMIADRFRGGRAATTGSAGSPGAWCAEQPTTG